MNVFYYSLNINKFNRISLCTSIKKMWNRFEVIHEGTNQMKESNIDMLLYKYELFKIESNEIITKIFTHFIDIINGLKSLDKSYTNSDFIRKILRSLEHGK